MELVPLRREEARGVLSTVCEHTARKRPSASQKRALDRAQPCWHPDGGHPAPRTMGKPNSVA
jgi:hypothetical protein